MILKHASSDIKLVESRLHLRQDYSGNQNISKAYLTTDLPVVALTCIL